MPMITEDSSDDDIPPARLSRPPILKTPIIKNQPPPYPGSVHNENVPGQGDDTEVLPSQQPATDFYPTDRRRRYEPSSSGLQLPNIPDIVSKKYNYLPGPALAYTVTACKGTSVYKRLRTLVWDFHSDLEDINKKRENTWTILVDRLDSMLVDMRHTLEAKEFKESFPLYKQALGNEKEGLAAWTILTQNQMAEISNWTDQAGLQAWEVNIANCS